MTPAIATCLLIFGGSTARAESDPATDDIKITADNKQISENGDVVATGNVQISQGKRVVNTSAIGYNANNHAIDVPGKVELDDPQLRLSGTSAKVDPQGDAEFVGTQFELPARNGRGSADRIRLSRSGEIDLNGVSYTTCPNPNPDWQLRVKHLHIDAQENEGSATNVRLEIKGIPILPIPYISFPVGNQRKTGLLFPSVGNSSRSGTSLTQPWYWNIAPNYDATITPTGYSARGFDLGTEFRFLTTNHKGSIHSHYLPDDRIEQIDRSLVSINTLSDFTDRLRVTSNATNVSDRNYFQDLNSALSSTVVVPRNLQMQYRLDDWMFSAHAQQFQIIDKEVDEQQIPYVQRPYAMLPQLAMRGYFPDRAFGLTAQMEAEFVAFRRNNDNLPTGEQDYNGNRFDVMPELRLPIRGASGYIEPAIAWRYTAYQFTDERTPLPTHSASRSLPIASLDSSITFERITGNGSRIQTFEPRVLYLYVPYRKQDSLPIFDTARPDLTLVQLFRTNRYVGADRVGDANQVAYGFTSRLLNRADGQQYLSATVGQTIRYSTPQVTLLGEGPGIYDRSDVIGELTLNAFRNWTVQAGVQLNTYRRRPERTELNIQYRPDNDRVINVGYRFREPNSVQISAAAEQPLEQVYGSFAWPITSQISSIGRVVYSIKDRYQTQDQTAIEQFAGLEYRSCCWNMRLVAGRSLATRGGEFDNRVLFQFELKGLSSVGNADAFLSQSIPGYSARTDSPRTP